MTILVNKKKCTGCGICVKICQYNAINLYKKIASIDGYCTGCTDCISTCKFKALENKVEQEHVPDLSIYQGIWVFIEIKNNQLTSVSEELIKEAKRLSNTLQEEVSAILIGNNEIEYLIPNITKLDIHNLYLVKHDRLKNYSTLPYTKIISKLIKLHKPSILLLGATPLGRDLAPRISRRLNLGLTADCTHLEIDKKNKNLLQTRPALGGNIMATICTPRSRPQISTIRPGVMSSPLSLPNKVKTKVIDESKKINLGSEDFLIKWLSSTNIESNKFSDIHKAEIIIAGGRGCRNKEGFKLLYRLAKKLKAEVGGTRVAVEKGWIESQFQIGQTGITVNPKIYVACGISGAIQHRAGILNSQYIIAINKNPNAPIFSIADLAIVGDIFKIIPSISAKIEKEL